MPIYEYRCASCGRIFEKLVRMGGDERPACTGCGASDARRLMSAIARPGGDCGPSGLT